MTEETILKKANSKKGLTEEIATRKRALNFYSLANIQSENYLKMSDPIEIKIDNKEVESRLLDLAQRSENLRPLMKNIAGIFAYSTEENFKEEGRPKWECVNCKCGDNCTCTEDKCNCPPECNEPPKK